MFLGPVSQLPNGISVGSAVFAYTAAKPPNAFRWADNPKNWPLRFLHNLVLHSLYSASKMVERDVTYCTIIRGEPSHSRD